MEDDDRVIYRKALGRFVVHLDASALGVLTVMNDHTQTAERIDITSDDLQDLRYLANRALMALELIDPACKRD